jgi:hypothetical protein
MNYNLVVNGDTGCTDCGDLYMTDNGRCVSTGLQIENNAIFGSGPGNGLGGSGGVPGSIKAIYIDDWTCNGIISGNVITQNKGAGSPPSQYDIFIHGGANWTVANNVLQVVNALDLPTPSASYNDFFMTEHGTQAFAFQGCGTCNGGAGGSGAGVSFQHNIVFTANKWGGDSLFYVQGTSTTPAVSANDYFSYAGATLTNYGLADSNPFHLNPTFTNRTANDFSGVNAALASAITWTALPGGQGPLPYGVVIAGAASPSQSRLGIDDLESQAAPAQFPNPQMPLLTAVSEVDNHADSTRSWK